MASSGWLGPGLLALGAGLAVLLRWKHVLAALARRKTIGHAHREVEPVVHRDRTPGAGSRLRLALQETNLSRGNTWIIGEGRRERELVPLPAPVCEAIRRYLAHRGGLAGPLFVARGHRGKNRDRHLETRSVLRSVRTLGQRVGLHVCRRGLRHSSTTAALEVAATAGISFDKVRAHSRHAEIGTLAIYADEHDRQSTPETLADLEAARCRRIVAGG